MKFHSFHLALVLAIGLANAAIAADPTGPTVSADDALTKLKTGNERFANSKESAGNLVDDYALGSIEYAVDHLGARLVVVLGHERCGAVSAALGSDSAPGHINSLVRDIQPAITATKGKEGDALANAVRENDALVAAKIRKQAQLGDLASEVQIVEGYYDLDTGKVEWTKE